MKVLFSALMTCLCLVTLARADTIILRDGASYSGEFEGGTTITFTDTQGIVYQFPRGDVQSLVLASPLDTVTLRNGKSYSGHFTGANPIPFSGSEGIKYQFPDGAVDSVVFSGGPAEVVSAPRIVKVIPSGTDISVRTDETIDSAASRPGQLYRGAIANTLLDSAGNVAIPAGTRADLMIRDISTGGAVHSPELVLDLYSVTLDGKQFRVVTSDVDRNNGSGIGRNRRTAGFLGGGTALGALLGGVFGGGRGAGIGALAGAGGGALTQVFTRGKRVQIPAESVLQFRLERTMVLRLQP